MKFRYLWLTISIFACASLSAFNPDETKAFDQLVSLARSDQENFCKRGLSFLVKSIRSDEGEACNNPIGAALAVMACKNYGTFNGSKCDTKAKALGIIDFVSANKALDKINLQSGEVTFQKLCAKVTDILPNIEVECNKIISFIKLPSMFDLKPLPGQKPAPKAVDVFFPVKPELRVVKELKERVA